MQDSEPIYVQRLWHSLVGILAVLQLLLCHRQLLLVGFCFCFQLPHTLLQQLNEFIVLHDSNKQCQCTMWRHATWRCTR